MFAIFENDNRPCHQCKKEIPADSEDDVLFQDPDADPQVLSLHLRFCSIECAQAYVDDNKQRWTDEGKDKR